MADWNYRGFSVAEAAAMSGLNRAILDVIVSRNKAIDVLFSQKRGHRRWFSPRDIAVLRVAFELERAGRTWLRALGAAFDNLQVPPSTDALLIAPAVIKRACGSPRVIADRDVPRLPFDVSTIVIPVGRIVADIRARCAELQEADSVALQ